MPLDGLPLSWWWRCHQEVFAAWERRDRPIAEGELDVLQDGELLHQCGRGEGVGEIALLRAIPRTATVIARTAATVYELDREPFLTAVLGHAPTLRQADRIADTRLAAGAQPGNRDGSESGTAEAGKCSRG